MAHAYWRVYITAMQNPGSTITLNEIIFRSTPGGASIATGGTASASNTYGGNVGAYGPEHAFDSNAGTICATDVTAPQWIAYAFPAPVSVVELGIKSSPSNSVNEMPSAGRVEFSDDGVTWTSSYSFTIGPFATNDETLTASPVVTPTVGLDDSEARIFSILETDEGPIDASEARVFSIYNYPSEAVEVSQDYNHLVVKRDSDMEVSEARVFAVVRGRIENHRVRAFPFRLDGHDNVALRLGESETLVWDFTTGQWSRWSSEVDNNVWRPSIGNNWTGMGKPFYDDGLDSDVILGDDTFGLLWGLDPSSGIDQHPDEERDDLPYIRKVVGGVGMRLRDTLQVGAVYLTADVGTPQVDDATVSLRTSDDYGKTWQSHGSITVEPGNYDQEFAWRSLGLIKAPGRIFEISDNGATVRIDSLDMR